MRSCEHAAVPDPDTSATPADAPPSEADLAAAGQRWQRAAEHLRSPEGVAATAATTAAAVSTDAATAKATAKTTADALTALGQRGINRIWEYTQAAIALGVVAVTMYVVIRDGEIPPELTGIAASIVATYFTRTNHSAVGGVGPPPRERRGE
jgi:hypothetical protein